MHELNTRKKTLPHWNHILLRHLALFDIMVPSKYLPNRIAGFCVFRKWFTNVIVIIKRITDCFNDSVSPCRHFTSASVTNLQLLSYIMWIVTNLDYIFPVWALLHDYGCVCSPQIPALPFFVSLCRDVDKHVWILVSVMREGPNILTLWVHIHRLTSVFWGRY